jgi:glycosyltransferase involved in cell wall biosynthesis
VGAIDRLKMRILQVVHLFPPEQSAGTERYTQALARTLVARGHECLVLAGSTESASEPGVLIRGQDGLTVARLVGVRQRSGFRVDSYNAAADGLIRTVLDVWRPDLVHLQHWYRLTGNLAAICAQAGIPVVVTLHDQWLACPRFHRVRPDGTFCAEREVSCIACVDRDPWQTDQEIGREQDVRAHLLAEELRLAGRLLVPSEAQRRFLSRIADIPPDRLQVVPLGSPVEWSPVTGGERRANGEGPLRIGYWGYLAPLKGVHTLLEAARVLAGESDGRFEWHLLGSSTDSAYDEKLRTLAEGLPVTFHGPYLHGDVAVLDFDVVVFPSLCYETYSFVLDEAFQLGLPVLVPDLGAPADRIGGRGMAFRTGDPHDLAQRLRLLLQEPHRLEEMRDSPPGGGVVTMDTHARDLEKIYHETSLLKPPSSDGAATYRVLLTHREQQLADREQRLSEQQRHIEELMADREQRLSEQQRHIEELMADLAVRNERLQVQHEEAERLQVGLADLERLLAAARTDLDAKVAETEAVREALEARNRETAELHAQTAAQDALLLELQANLAARTQEADGLRREAEESNRLLLEARQSILGSLDAKLKGVVRRIGGKDR